MRRRGPKLRQQDPKNWELGQICHSGFNSEKKPALKSGSVNFPPPHFAAIRRTSASPPGSRTNSWFLYSSKKKRISPECFGITCGLIFFCAGLALGTSDLRRLGGSACGLGVGCGRTNSKKLASKVGLKKGKKNQKFKNNLISFCFLC